MKRILALTLALLLLLTACAAPSEPTAQPEAPAETQTPAEPEKPAKKEWKTLNILMIGNSFCYYYVQELYGMAYMAGYKLNLCNLYKAGCSVEEHWTWLNDDSQNYEFWVTDSMGRRRHETIKTSKEALAYAPWDVITLQQHFAPSTTATYDKALASCTPYVKDYFDYLKSNHPDAMLYWQQTWAYEVGHSTMPDTETQTTQHTNIRLVSRTICEENDVSIIPSGDAWALARANPDIGDTLCKDDHAHDGDMGGGQYLNACVWFEVLLGQSCIGNTWRPNDYHLNEKKALALQQHAHEAVAAIYGEDYAK